MCRYADLIARTFGRGEASAAALLRHEEIELALVKLARFTGESRYMDLARSFIDERGRQPHYFDIEARARGSDPAAWYHGVSTNTTSPTFRCASRDRGGGPRVHRHVSVFSDGGPGSRGCRPGPARRLCPGCGAI